MVGQIKQSEDVSLGSGNFLWAIAAIEDTVMSFSIVSGYFWVLLT